MNFAFEMQTGQIFKYTLSTKMMLIVINVPEKLEDKNLKNNKSSHTVFVLGIK